MSITISKKQVVITKGGFATTKEIDKVDPTDKVLFTGTADECEAVLHGGKRR